MNIAKKAVGIFCIWAMWLLAFRPIFVSAMSVSEFESRIYAFQIDYPSGYCHNNESWFINGGPVGWQCFGFANVMAYNVWGTYPTTSSSAYNVNEGWTIIYANVSDSKVDAVQVGDVVRFRSSLENDHSIFVTGIFGDTICYADCNGNGDDVIHYGRTISKSGLAAKMVQPLANNAELCGWIAHNMSGIRPDDTESPVISDVRITEMDASGYTVLCTVNDNEGVTRVAFPTFPDANNEWTAVWMDGTVTGDTASFRVNVSDHGDWVNTAYETHIYAYDAAGNTAVYGCEKLILDTEVPVIENVVFADRDKTGYIVTAEVYDNIAVSNILVKTWTYIGEEWSCREAVVLPDGNLFTYRVDVSEFDNEYDDLYKTDIVVSDAYGNEARYEGIAENVYTPEPIWKKILAWGPAGTIVIVLVGVTAAARKRKMRRKAAVRRRKY